MAKKEATPNGDTVENIFWREHYREKNKYDEKVNELRQDHGTINRVMKALKNEAIVLVDSTDVNRIKHRYEIDLFKLMEDECGKRRRPYFKCAKTSSYRITVQYTGTNSARGLLTPLLLVAEPIKITNRTVRKRDTGWLKEEPMLPDFFGDAGIGYSDAHVRHWVTDRSITILFQHSEGAKQFREWRDRCLATSLNRMLLGLHTYSGQ